MSIHLVEKSSDKLIYQTTKRSIMLGVILVLFPLCMMLVIIPRCMEDISICLIYLVFFLIIGFVATLIHKNTWRFDKKSERLYFTRQFILSRKTEVKTFPIADIKLRITKEKSSKSNWKGEYNYVYTLNIDTPEASYNMTCGQEGYIQDLANEINTWLGRHKEVNAIRKEIKIIDKK